MGFFNELGDQLKKKNKRVFSYSEQERKSLGHKKVKDGYSVSARLRPSRTSVTGYAKTRKQAERDVRLAKRLKANDIKIKRNYKWVKAKPVKKRPKRPNKIQSYGQMVDFNNLYRRKPIKPKKVKPRPLKIRKKGKNEFVIAFYD